MKYITNLNAEPRKGWCIYGATYIMLNLPRGYHPSQNPFDFQAILIHLMGWLLTVIMTSVFLAEAVLF